MHDDVTAHAASAAARKLYRNEIEPQIESAIKKAAIKKNDDFDAAFYAVVAEEVTEAMRSARLSHRDEVPTPELAAEHAIAEIACAKSAIATAAHILRDYCLRGDERAFELVEKIDELKREIEEGVADFQRSALRQQNAG